MVAAATLRRARAEGFSYQAAGTGAALTLAALAIAWGTTSVFRMQSVLAVLLCILCFTQPRGDMEHALLYAIDSFANDMRLSKRVATGATWAIAAAWGSSHWLAWALMG
uniref:Uncharacterized protein n=1 Tax=Prasinoderma coloniale TaxID=156133 RepID=A0A7R9Y1I8_9VIRI|eukprot:PRCOL_00005107-RA